MSHPDQIDLELNTRNIGQVLPSDPTPSSHEYQEPVVSCGYCTNMKRVRDVNNFSIGQHLLIPGTCTRKSCECIACCLYKCTHNKFKHVCDKHAIVKNVERMSQNSVNLDLIYFIQDSKTCTIQIESGTKDYNDDKEINDVIYLVTYKHPRYKGEEVVQKAQEKLLGCHPCRLCYKNAEYTAKSCIVGENDSSCLQCLQPLICKKVPTWILKWLARIAVNYTDEILTSVTGNISTASIALGIEVVMYLLYNIGTTVRYKMISNEKGMCHQCWKSKILDLWLTFAVFCITSLITYTIQHFVPGIESIQNYLVYPLIAIFTLLQWLVSSIREKCCTCLS